MDNSCQFLFLLLLCMMRSLLLLAYCYFLSIDAYGKME